MSVGTGLFVMIAVAYTFGIGTAYHERSTLLAAAIGEPPADGKWVAVTGPIHSMHSLQGPISGESVVAYEYSIWRTEGSGKSSSRVNYWDGKALVPSSISTRHGSVRLLAVPSFTDIPLAEFRRHQDAVENARQYIASTQFFTRKSPKEERVGINEESTDDDGNFRMDRRGSESDVDVESCTLEERHIRQNETVCAFGLYSQQRGGIIPHPNWAKQTRLMRGDAQTVADRLRSRMIKYFIGILCFAAAAYGVVRLYTHSVVAP
jgi:hypothetical protein